MGIKRSPSQKGVLPGHVKYKVDYTFEVQKEGRTVEKRKREKIIVPISKRMRNAFEEWKKATYEKVARSLDTSGLFFETFNLYLELFTKIEKNEQQFKHEKSCMRRLFKVFFMEKGYGNIRVKDVRRKHIDEYIGWRIVQKSRIGDQTVKPATVNNEVFILSSFFSWCIEREYYDRINPCSKRRLKTNNERHIDLSPEQVRNMLEKSRDFDRLYSPLFIVLYTGLRRAELLGLHWSDVNLAKRGQGYIHVRSESAKFDKKRNIPIIDTLEKHLRGLERKGDMVVNLSETQLKKRWYKLRKTLPFVNELPVEKFTFHDTRHVFAQSAVNAGVDPVFLSRILGHSDPKITINRYAQGYTYRGHQRLSIINNYYDIEDEPVEKDTIDQLPSELYDLKKAN
ncbi:tyrosine-type recombinase/integrase [Spirochaetota bacterium]